MPGVSFLLSRLLAKDLHKAFLLKPARPQALTSGKGRESVLVASLPSSSAVTRTNASTSSSVDFVPAAGLLFAPIGCKSRYSGYKARQVSTRRAILSPGLSCRRFDFQREVLGPVSSRRLQASACVKSNSEVVLHSSDDFTEDHKIPATTSVDSEGGDQRQAEVAIEGDLPPASEASDQLAGESAEERSGKLLVLDGTALVYRAYFKVNAFIQKTQQPWDGKDVSAGDEASVGTVFVFLDIVASVLLHWGPSHVAIVLDHPGPTFRDELYASYKAGRDPMPDPLREAFPYVEAALCSLGMPPLKIKGVEADDVIATLTVEGVKQHMEVKIVSPDKDFFQLLGPRVSILRPTYASSASLQPQGLVDDSWIDSMVRFSDFREADFVEKFKIKPHQFVDWLALVGDACDNVPGVRGIGEKTAPKLLLKFGTLEEVLSRAEEVKEKRYREALQRVEVASEAMFWKTLVQLKSDVPLERCFSSLALKTPCEENLDSFWGLIDALEIDSLNMGRVATKIERMLDTFPK